MKNYIIILLLFVSITAKSQEKKITTFHRMLIFNKENKLLVVKIKNRDLWLTPGLYQNNKQSITQGIDSIANTYGIKVSDISLRGIYGLKTPSKNNFSTRNIFAMKTNTQKIVLPDFIEKAIWMDLKTVSTKIKLPHINYFINDICKFPEDIRLGMVTRFEKNGKLVSEISEKFYSLKQ